jgi:hypothetical protein
MQLSTAVGVHIDTLLTASAAIKDITIYSNWCANRYISYSNWFVVGYISHSNCSD